MLAEMVIGAAVAVIDYPAFNVADVQLFSHLVFTRVACFEQW